MLSDKQKEFSRLHGFAMTNPTTNSTLITRVGAKPFRNFPGNAEFLVGRPKKYLTGPALVMDQETRRVSSVEEMSTTGKDPANRQIETSSCHGPV